MSPTAFEPTEFLARVAERLVMEFAHAGQAGTPGLKGDAREHPARKQLERLLPGAAGVGTGLVFDSTRKVSRQQDIVIYEKALSPVFSINDTPEATYYPIEGVVAVGEVKSSLGSKELTDAFEKVASVKRLRRHAQPEEGALSQGMVTAYRNYGATTSFVGTKSEEYDQDAKDLDQVFGFILCNRFGVSADTMLDHARDLWRDSPPELAPNALISLNDGFICPSQGGSLLLSSLGANGAALCEVPPEGFPFLVRRLNHCFRMGRTVPSSTYDRYLRMPDLPLHLPVTVNTFDDMPPQDGPHA